MLHFSSSIPQYTLYKKHDVYVWFNVGENKFLIYLQKRLYVQLENTAMYSTSSALTSFVILWNCVLIITALPDIIRIGKRNWKVVWAIDFSIYFFLNSSFLLNMFWCTASDDAVNCCASIKSLNSITVIKAIIKFCSILQWANWKTYLNREPEHSSMQKIKGIDHKFYFLLYFVLIFLRSWLKM